MSITSMITDVVVGSVFDYHTYVGVALGALFTPFWVVVYNFLKAKLVKATPAAAPVIAEVEAAVKVVEAEAAPVISAVESNPAVQAAQPK